MQKEILYIHHLPEKARGGDRCAFQEIYQLFYDRLIRYGCSLGYDESQLHDVIQDLFVWLIQNPEKLNGISSLHTYLFKCLRRNINTSLKREIKKKHNAWQYHENQQKEVSAESRLIEYETQKDWSSWILAQLNLLSSHQKEVIYLRFYENLSYDEMAEIFSVSKQVVRNSVFRALKRLRKNMSNEKSNPLKGLYPLFSLFF